MRKTSQLNFQPSPLPTLQKHKRIRNDSLSQSRKAQKNRNIKRGFSQFVYILQCNRFAGLFSFSVAIVFLPSTINCNRLRLVFDFLFLLEFCYRHLIRHSFFDASVVKCLLVNSRLYAPNEMYFFADSER